MAMLESRETALTAGNNDLRSSEALSFKCTDMYDMGSDSDSDSSSATHRIHVQGLEKHKLMGKPGKPQINWKALKTPLKCL